LTDFTNFRLARLAGDRSDPISRWVHGLREKHGWQKAAVALANKNARILWAVMTKGAGV
jgi:transposase